MQIRIKQRHNFISHIPILLRSKNTSIKQHKHKRKSRKKNSKNHKKEKEGVT